MKQQHEVRGAISQLGASVPSGKPCWMYETDPSWSKIRLNHVRTLDHHGCVSYEWGMGLQGVRPWRSYLGSQARIFVVIGRRGSGSLRASRLFVGVQVLLYEIE